MRCTGATNQKTRHEPSSSASALQWWFRIGLGEGQSTEQRDLLQWKLLQETQETRPGSSKCGKEQLKFNQKQAKTWKIMEDPGTNGENVERTIEIIQFPATKLSKVAKVSTHTLCSILMLRLDQWHDKNMVQNARTVRSKVCLTGYAQRNLAPVDMVEFLLRNSY